MKEKKKLFKYLIQFLNYKDILIYGKLSNEILKDIIKISKSTTVIGDKKIEKELITNKKFLYQKNLYNINKKFDWIINLENTPLNINYNNMTDKTIFIEAIRIKDKEHYRSILLSKNNSNFLFNKELNIYEKLTTFFVSTENSLVINSNIFDNMIPNYILYFRSNSNFFIKNGSII